MNIFILLKKSDNTDNADVPVDPNCSLFQRATFTSLVFSFHTFIGLSLKAGCQFPHLSVQPASQPTSHPPNHSPTVFQADLR